MKKKIMAASLLVICLSIFAAGSLAFFTSEKAAHNVITTGGVDIELLEWADAGKTQEFPEDGIEGAMPGSEITKIVEVKNVGASDAWIRVKATVDIDLQNTVGVVADTSLISINFNTEDWTKQGDYYYFNHVVKPGEMTSPLFSTVTLSAEMDNNYAQSTIVVDVNAEAVQVANNGESALEAAGWTGETI